MPSEINTWSVVACHPRSSPFLGVEHTSAIQCNSDSQSISGIQGGHVAVMEVLSAPIDIVEIIVFPEGILEISP